MTSRAWRDRLLWAFEAGLHPALAEAQRRVHSAEQSQIERTPVEHARPPPFGGREQLRLCVAAQQVPVVDSEHDIREVRGVLNEPQQHVVLPYSHPGADHRPVREELAEGLESPDPIREELVEILLGRVVQQEEVQSPPRRAQEPERLPQGVMDTLPREGRVAAVLRAGIPTLGYESHAPREPGTPAPAAPQLVQGESDPLLAPSAPVVGAGVDERDPELHRASDAGDGVGLGHGSVDLPEPDPAEPE
eukprot:CAMPEP_0114517786 /NCGR_PEP_ID=MMETSP0109-20121206/18085_1 /TAXON_ID=29199 /ORGANISM="Chlorarachnion reptans, Strain CCCM449" /LENGTH=247 /DNA_ID=CAMNT_0001698341 /DNA_START=415 /DNA_END=1156 /DNA_ORIENTATION=+